MTELHGHARIRVVVDFWLLHYFLACRIGWLWLILCSIKRTSIPRIPSHQQPLEGTDIHAFPGRVPIGDLQRLALPCLHLHLHLSLQYLRGRTRLWIPRIVVPLLRRRLATIAWCTITPTERIVHLLKDLRCYQPWLLLPWLVVRPLRRVGTQRWRREHTDLLDDFLLLQRLFLWCGRRRFRLGGRRGGGGAEGHGRGWLRGARDGGCIEYEVGWCF